MADALHGCDGCDTLFDSDERLVAHDCRQDHVCAACRTPFPNPVAHARHAEVCAATKPPGPAHLNPRLKSR
jgi:hypothetical protein